MRLRRTGASGRRGAPLKPAPRRERKFGSPHTRNGGKYWLPVILVAVVLCYAQCRWFDKAKKSRAASLDSPLANKIAEKMLEMKGIKPEGEGKASGNASQSQGGGVAWGSGAAAGGTAESRGHVETCETCEGTGRAEDGGLCPLCLGHGARYLRRAPNEHICPSCVGMGRVLQEDGTPAECPRCGGRGVE